MRPAALALTPVAVAVLLAGTTARADDSELADAIAELAEAEKALTSAPCDTMCKALQSMIRAADRICELARDGTATDQKRCTDARTKVAEATARVRASCPNCDPSPPYAPSTTPVTPKTDETKPMAPPMPASSAVAREEYAAAQAVARPRTTLAVDVLPFFAPPWIAQVRLERAVAERFSITLIGAYGSLPKLGPEGAGRTSVLGVGGEARGYLFGSFDRFGIFLAADVMYRNASNVGYREYLDARMFPLGLTAGALVGSKLVVAGGLTIEARLGPAFVLDDRRNEGPRNRVLPNGGVSLGWTF